MAELEAKSGIVEFLRKRDYLLVRELGAGACGRTVLLRDEQIDEQFVCKKYHPYSESARGPLFDNFVREIKLLHRVHHLNLVRIFNYYIYPEKQLGYILMEFVDGYDIHTYVKSSPDKINDLFIQAIRGFTYLESCGILHRDIRPGNLMVASDGRLKIIDLGFGKQIRTNVDFEKSISLNWWCSAPDEFRDQVYNFQTEVYFVGKLFDGLIASDGIQNFKYKDVLQRMSAASPTARIGSFAEVQQAIDSDQFYETEFTAFEKSTYRAFSVALCKQITKVHPLPKWRNDPHEVERLLREKYQLFMLEKEVPNADLVISCFLDGPYHYIKGGFGVDLVQSFLMMFKPCNIEKKKVLLANLQTKIEALPKYSDDPKGDDIPF